MCYFFIVPPQGFCDNFLQRDGVLFYIFENNKYNAQTVLHVSMRVVFSLDLKFQVSTRHFNWKMKTTTSECHRDYDNPGRKFFITSK